MSKVWWLLRSSWKHELKLYHNSSDTKGNALRTNVKIVKWNETFSRQRLSQSCLFKSMKIKKKKKRKQNTTNYKFLPLNIFIWKDKTEALSLSWETIQVIPAATSKTAHCIVVHTTQSKNSEPSENFAILKKCPRKLDYLIFEILLIKKKRPDIKLTEHTQYRSIQSWLVVLIDSRLTLPIRVRP